MDKKIRDVTTSKRVCVCSLTMRLCMCTQIARLEWARRCWQYPPGAALPLRSRTVALATYCCCCCCCCHTYCVLLSIFSDASAFLPHVPTTTTDDNVVHLSVTLVPFYNLWLLAW